MRSLRQLCFASAAFIVSAVYLPHSAAACGGFFCNRTQPINQAAEGIIFADNGDGTITAVIQIKYQGPSQNFSWLLPIAPGPKKASDIGVGSDIAFQRLQSATNPAYSLTTRVEGTCKQQDFGLGNASGGPTAVGGSASISAPGAARGSDGVTVEASGVVGAYDFVVLSVDQSSANPADAAVKWLTDNMFDVPSGAPDLLGGYLSQGMDLLALRLTKGADTGSIRPIIVTYAGTQASIPMKLTAVAANDDMPVLTYVLGASQAVPANYQSLKLNEARINWFNAASNYNSVVIDAANDAGGGQGFVTEFAGKSSTVKGVVWTPSDDANWTSFKSTVYGSFSDFFLQAYQQYGQYDGFWDATQAAVTLPSGVAFADFKLCPNCYASQVQFSPTDYVAKLQTSVIDPIQAVQNLIDAHPALTRLYTTLSAPEMTQDPLFTFNPDMPDVSNVHTAERVIECNPTIFESDAPWRVQLPQGSVVRGTATDAASQTWPAGLDSLPPNLMILSTSSSGPGKLIEDNTAVINQMLSSGTASGNTGASAMSAGGGCSVAPGSSPISALFGLFALAGAALRKRRRN